MMDDLATLLPTSKATWLLVISGVITAAFALSAFACDRLGHTIISPFLAAGAWLFGAFAVLLWSGASTEARGVAPTHHQIPGALVVTVITAGCA